MNILFALVPLSLVLMAGAVWALFWAVDHGQFDALDECGRAILNDDDDTPQMSDSAAANGINDRPGGAKQGPQ